MWSTSAVRARRRLFLGVLAFCAASFAFSSAVASATLSKTSRGTRVISYQPFMASGIKPNLHVSARLTGTCIRYGGGVARRYYYRCFAKTGGIYDPCFAGGQGTAKPLVCPLKPTSDDVVELRVEEITMTLPPWKAVRPWAMRLTSGEVCVFVSAAWSGLGPYDCQASSNTSAVADCRQPHSSKPSWTASCQDRKSQSSSFTSTTVASVWF